MYFCPFKKYFPDFCCIKVFTLFFFKLTVWKSYILILRNRIISIITLSLENFLFSLLENLKGIYNFIGFSLWSTSGKE